MRKTTILLFLLFNIFIYSTEENSKTKIAYSKNGELYFNYIGEENSKPLTTGYYDMKPSLSKTGRMIVFFRAVDTTQPIAFWKTAICIINIDGTGFKQITCGRYADYNPTWSRDGSNKIIFSRYDGNAEKSYIYKSDIDYKPGEEMLISDPINSEYAYSCLNDGRILIVSSRNIFKGMYYLLTPVEKGKGKYDLINYKFNLEGFMDRVTFNPGETKISYEYKKGWKSFEYTDKKIIIADFDLNTLTISNPMTITEETKSGIMTIYPCWTKDESCIIYHSNRSGKKQLYLYSINDKTTQKISIDKNSDYEFPCGEESPK